MTTLTVIVHFSLEMSKYSVPERISIAKAYYSSNNSPIAAQRKFATEYKLQTTGSRVITIKNKIEKFVRTGSVVASKLPVRIGVSIPRHFSNFCRIWLVVCATSWPLMESISDMP
ncbi:hypothetical protein AVEN_220985-1 [Araneus ventricosus]|uniref:DUF4817 domain-containing protein n=1 Tax=Araneus ventricosus TaxID=182803 RepID=A0A4Y2ER46_ARAVE|nr:hypothetical protein AVEN_220985-1 [Araneus ventricosus]